VTPDTGAAIHNPPDPETGAGSLIHLDAVWRVYPRGHVTAVREATFFVRHGDYIAITGPSGSGKSTLLHLAGGLDRPTRGRVLFEGREMQTPLQWTRLRARRIGFVFQAFHLIAGFTAAENVEVAMFGVERRERERKRRAAELLDRTGLSHRRCHHVSELSGGECQRVAIARALANSPDVILADEPTGNLDSQNAEGVLGLLEDLHAADGISLVVVTHDPRVSERAGRMVQLLDGQIVSDRPGGRAA
jgi:putative ABC transport system ATP-binding protein